MQLFPLNRYINGKKSPKPVVESYDCIGIFKRYHLCNEQVGGKQFDNYFQHSPLFANAIMIITVAQQSIGWLTCSLLTVHNFPPRDLCHSRSVPIRRSISVSSSAPASTTSRSRTSATSGRLLSKVSLKRNGSGCGSDFHVPAAISVANKHLQFLSHAHTTRSDGVVLGNIILYMRNPFSFPFSELMRAFSVPFSFSASHRRCRV